MKDKGKAYIIPMVVFLALLLTISSVYAAIPERINYQGYLTDNSGEPITITVSMTFRIYTVASGGTALWTETQSVTPAEGVFSVVLGSTNALFLDYSVNSQYYLGVQIGTDAEMTPRQLITSVGSSHTADTALDLTCTNCVSGAEVNISEIQKRVTETCAAGNSIREIKSDGTVICEPDDGIAAETDPQVGAVTLSKWCVGDGAAVQCSMNPPVLSETDPKVGVLTSSKWCTTNGTQVICTSDAPTSSSGWTDDGTVVSLTTNTDKVGIGTTTLSEELHVKDTVGQIYLQGIFQGTTSSGGIALLANNGQQYELQSLNNGGFALYDRTDEKYSLYVDTTQNVGIGDMTSPQQKLDVNGQIRAKSGYGDYIRLGGDNVGGDVEISISAPSERNHISFWNEQLAQATNLGAKNIFINGASITTSGWTSPHLNLVLSSDASYNSKILQATDGLIFRNFSQPADDFVSLFSFRDNTDQKLMNLTSGYAYFYVEGIFLNDLTCYGDTYLLGELTKPLGSFKIDHPLDPENKYLYHSFVESPDMMNIYNGNVILDNNGETWVDLPEWFEALNQDFRYQLTCIGGFAPVYIESEIAGNRFKIAGGKKGMKVSWQVTGIRHDPIADLKRIKVEENKPENEKGLYLYPEAYGMPEEKGIHQIR